MGQTLVRSLPVPNPQRQWADSHRSGWSEYPGSAGGSGGSFATWDSASTPLSLQFYWILIILTSNMCCGLWENWCFSCSIIKMWFFFFLVGKNIGILHLVLMLPSSVKLYFPWLFWGLAYSWCQGMHLPKYGKKKNLQTANTWIKGNYYFRDNTVDNKKH